MFYILFMRKMTLQIFQVIYFTLLCPNRLAKGESHALMYFFNNRILEKSRNICEVLHQKDGPHSQLVCPFFASKKVAKRSEKDAKTNSKLAILSKTKRNKVRIPQFRLHEPYKQF
jgi:hypothetical protein